MRPAASPGGAPPALPAIASLPAAMIAAARASSASASASVAGHIGLNVNHWSGAGRTSCSRPSAMRWVAASSVAGLESATSIGSSATGR